MPPRMEVGPATVHEREGGQGRGRHPIGRVLQCLLPDVLRLPLARIEEEGGHPVWGKPGSQQMHQGVEAHVLGMLGPGLPRLEVDDEPAGQTENEIGLPREDDPAVGQERLEGKFRLWRPPSQQRREGFAEQDEVAPGFGDDLAPGERVEPGPVAAERGVAVRQAVGRALADGLGIRRSTRHHVELDGLVEEGARGRA